MTSDGSHSTRPFAIGVTLAELSVFTTDASGNRRYVVDPSVQHRRFELSRLAVYHHTACDSFLEPSASLLQLCDTLRAMVDREAGGSEGADGGQNGPSDSLEMQNQHPYQPSEQL